MKQYRSNKVIYFENFLCRDFYGFTDFPTKQLLTRTHQERKKHIYFVSEIVRNVVENNTDFLKVSDF